MRILSLNSVMELQYIHAKAKKVGWLVECLSYGCEAYLAIAITRENKYWSECNSSLARGFNWGGGVYIRIRRKLGWNGSMIFEKHKEFFVEHICIILRPWYVLYCWLMYALTSLLRMFFILYITDGIFISYRSSFLTKHLPFSSCSSFPFFPTLC